MLDAYIGLLEILSAVFKLASLALQKVSQILEVFSG